MTSVSNGASLDQEMVRKLLVQLGGQARVRDIAAAVYSTGLCEPGTIIAGNLSKRLSQLVKWGLVVKIRHGFYAIR